MGVKLLLLVGVPLALLALPGVVTVEWRPGGDEGQRVVLPVPVVLAQIALPFVPREARHLGSAPEFEPWLPLAEGLSRALQAHPDVVLATVNGSRERVRVHKKGLDLRVDFEGSCGDQVHCRLPLRSAERLLVACRDGSLSTSELGRTLWSLPAGEYVRLDVGGEQVRVGIWKL